MAINVGLIGYGLAGSTFHAPVIAAVQTLQLTGVVTSRKAAVARDLPDVAVFESPAAMLADPQIQLVVIATPNTTHFDLAQHALYADKHVVIDKPMTTTSAQADALISLAQERGRLLSVYQNRRWDNDFRTILALLEAGRMGEVYHYEAHFDRFRPNIKAGWREEPQPGSGALFDLGAHLIDQALVLFGMPDSVTADIMAQRPHSLVDDYFHIVLEYGKRRAIVHASTLVREPGAHFGIHGDAGSFVIFGMDPQEAALKAGRSIATSDWGRDDAASFGTLIAADGVRETIQTLPGSYAAFYAGMAAAIAGHGPVPVNATEARDVITIIEVAQRSASERRTIDVRRPNATSVGQQ